MTSSTRRDHWLAIVKEIMLLHKFLAKFKVESPLQKWEMHARTILGIIRLHAAREMLRISPPDPKSFLIFLLFDELPTGSNVLQEVAESLKTVDIGHPCSATSVLRNLNVSQGCTQHTEKETGIANNRPDNLESLETAVEQVREEAKEINIAKAKADELKDEGIGNSALVLMVRLSLKTKGCLICWFSWSPVGIEIQFHSNYASYLLDFVGFGDN